MLRPTRIQHVKLTIRKASTGPRVSPKPGQRFKPLAQSSNPFHDPAASPPSPPSRPLSSSRAISLIFASVFAGGLGFYATRLYIEARKPCQNPAIADIAQQKDVSGRYEATADSFDSDVGFSEFLMDINGMRRRLAQQCTGHVLEASCGTGRNLGYFNIGKEDGKVKSLTFVDLSPKMVDVCVRKWNVLWARKKAQIDPTLKVRFMTGSVIGEIPPAPTKQKYDTVLQTMGLCSTPSPLELLTNLVKHLDTSNPDARILLLEHGRGYYAWINNILDNAAEKHAEIHGCWFNRDIGAIVWEAARETGLEIAKERRHHFGTTWIFELKPSRSLVEQSSKTEQVESSLPVLQPSTTWWSSLRWR